MKGLIYAYVITYLIVLFMYFFSRTNKNFKIRAINKILLSSMFMIFSTFAFILNHSFNYHFIGLLATFFAFLGDIILLFSFSKGGIAFFTSNMAFFIYEILVVKNYNIHFSNIWFSILIYFFLIGGLWLLVLTRKLNLAQYKISFPLYLSSVSLHGCLAIPLTALLISNSIVTLPIGLCLFMISDYFILMYKFICNNNKWLIRVNSLTYFVGLLLVSLSFI